MSAYDELHQRRVQRAQKLMRDAGTDFLVIGPSSDFRYFTGAQARESERLTALLIPQEGKPVIVVPQLEAPLLEQLGDDFDFDIWIETDNPISRIAAQARRAGAETVAINDYIRGGFVLQLQEELRNRTYQRGMDILRTLRSIKDPVELDLLREASRRTDSAWDAYTADARVIGKTEQQIADELNAVMAEYGLPIIGVCIVATGPNGASPHHHTGDRRVKHGDAIVIDFGGIHEGYYSDVTRTPVAGYVPDEEFTRAYQTVLEAQEAAFQAIAPGVPCQDVDRAARAVIEDAGFGEYFIHRVGHGIGLTGHEDPYLVEGNTEKLQPGMVVSDEPGIYIPGRWGIRIEDTVVVTEDGRERYNHISREITVLE